MKKTFRLSMSWLHTWSGLGLCWVMYFIFVTGTLGYYDNEIDQWMMPELNVAKQQLLAQDLDIAIDFLNKTAPDADRWYITPANGRQNKQLKVSWRYPRNDRDPAHNNGSNILDNQTGLAVDHRETGGGQTLYKMHYRLHYLPSIGYEIVGIITMIMFVGLVTGVIIHKKIFADFFDLRIKKKQLAILDLHNISSVASLPFQLMITYSGLIFVASTWMPLVIYGAYGFDEQATNEAKQRRRSNLTINAAGYPATMLDTQTLAAKAEQQWGENNVHYIEVKFPNDANSYVVFNRHKTLPSQGREKLIYDASSGDRIAFSQNQNGVQKTSTIFINLHEGVFADYLIRWLYFISGILGCVMIATGAIRYVSKRRRPNTPLSTGQKNVDALNIGTIVGLPLAIVGYFIANRLLPSDMSDRSAWEAHIMFIVWFASLAYCYFRSYKKSWVELTALSAFACLLLPIINSLTTSRGMLNAFIDSDWDRFYFDLSHLMLALLLFYAAFKLHKFYSPQKSKGQQC